MLDLAGKAQDHYDLRHASLSNTQKYTPCNGGHHRRLQYRASEGVGSRGPGSRSASFILQIVVYLTDSDEPVVLEVGEIPYPQVREYPHETAD